LYYYHQSIYNKNRTNRCSQRAAIKELAKLNNPNSRNSKPNRKKKLVEKNLKNNKKLPLLKYLISIVGLTLLIFIVKNSNKIHEYLNKSLFMNIFTKE
jgi:hypothetical protein